MLNCVRGVLCPQDPAEFVGQAKVRAQLQLLLRAATLQNRTPDHIRWPYARFPARRPWQ
jgi:Holliday junction resolvasome RuvABC ATP-dependent DNA helicase subunit